MSSNPITVTSHVARDFLQNAAYFNTWSKIVWEYVANSLDAAPTGVLAVVAVEMTSRYVTISDNGSGMSRDDLRNFFQMHGENVQRKRGKRVRGRFGTGKSAAFGLANSLRIDSTQNGIRNVVELHRKDIETAKSGQPFPVCDVIVNERTDQDDGTRVDITDFNANVDVDKVIAYIERHLSRYRQRALVTINGHECKFQEPPASETFTVSPPPEVAQHIGDIPLVIKVSPVPLDDDTKGIDILSHGIWHETTLAGVEKKDRSSQLFGYIDVPALEDGEWPIPAFDNTRNNVLNRQNPVVVVLLAWLSEELEKVRRLLVEREREKQKTENAKKLAQEAKRIADILNDDFAQLEMELELTRRVSRRSGGKSVSEILDEHGELWPGDGEEITPWQETGHARQGNGGHGELAGEGDTPRPGPTAQPGSDKGARKGVEEGKRKSRRAVFSIDYENATAEHPRSRYDRETKTIFINLDHPQVAAAYDIGGKNIEAQQFRAVCYEIAAIEYALAVPFERLERDEFYHASDALFDVRDTINRVTRRFAVSHL